jgi:hypothetical protein
MKNLYSLEPDICIRYPDIITDSTIDLILPKYFYNQLQYLKNKELQDSTISAKQILNSLRKQENNNLLIFQNQNNGIIYFLDETKLFIEISDVNFDIQLPLDRYLLNLSTLSKKLEASIIFCATSSEVIKKCQYLNFFVVSEGISVISGKSWLQIETLLDESKTILQTDLLLQERYRILKSINLRKNKTFLGVDEGKPSKPRCIIQKFSTQTSESVELFRQKVRNLHRLDKHPRLPIVLDSFLQNDQQYLVQEFIDGVSLDRELVESGSFSEAQIISLLKDLLPVLLFLHTAGIIHGDIKPQNIIRRYSDRELVLVDFGAFDLITAHSLANEEIIIGSPEYAAPEQVMGKSVFASDLYSLGIVCIHLLTMLDPFDLLDRFELTWTWRDYLVDNPVSDRLGYILDKLVERSVKKRYSSAMEVLTDLYSHPMQWVNLEGISQIHWRDINSYGISWKDIRS